MVSAKELLDLDYLVYSSHKSGTQTLVHTLNRSGLKCRHCHFLSNIDIKRGGLEPYLEGYFKKNKKRLDVITVFREPMERHVSSFFQGYGSRPLRLKEAEDESETIIYQHTIKRLQKRFASELRSRSLIGFAESIHEICNELQIEVNDLEYSDDRRFGVFEGRLVRLYLFRFDTLFVDLRDLLSEITKKTIVIKTANMSDSKWYRDIYSEFKASLVIPDDIVSDVYSSKRDLISLFYSGDFASTLSKALIDYGGKRPICEHGSPLDRDFRQ